MEDRAFVKQKRGEAGRAKAKGKWNAAHSQTTHFCLLAMEERWNFGETLPQSRDGARVPRAAKGAADY